MAEHEFKPGDVVQLKSGGPKMTYEGEGQLGDALCTWFDGKKMERKGFTHATLMLAPPDKPRTATAFVVGRG